ncbi:hypothetical protein EFA46_016005 (plasmid) [Halarchaeum sp. CBA1220]|uniref:hypothetical protein n=1 Tax=Halarchaeum sp. CBA1220 TaxID=1853682 RepID=UPI001314EFDE|nr:hypothetical protein [Halarchaeum sp. CBA1220]QLC35761.1 hypothetical protein EFA46_016005 [Halarchaeum sp. CBA1220]
MRETHDRDLCESSPSGDYRAVYAVMAVPVPVNAAATPQRDERRERFTERWDA